MSLTYSTFWSGNNQYKRFAKHPGMRRPHCSVSNQTWTLCHSIISETYSNPLQPFFDNIVDQPDLRTLCITSQSNPSKSYAYKISSQFLLYSIRYQNNKTITSFPSFNSTHQSNLAPTSRYLGTYLPGCFSRIRKYSSSRYSYDRGKDYALAVSVR